MNITQNCINTQEVAKRLNCTVRNISMLVNKGILEPIIKEKRLFMFNSLDIEKLRLKRDLKKTNKLIETA